MHEYEGDFSFFLLERAGGLEKGKKGREEKQGRRIATQASEAARCSGLWLRRKRDYFPRR